jgi:hypothetical protein
MMTIYDKPIVLRTNKTFTDDELKALIDSVSAEPLRIALDPLTMLTQDPAIIEIDRLNRELEAAATYIEENEVIHKKFKKNIPTVIEYQGRRYVLDDRN